MNTLETNEKQQKSSAKIGDKAEPNGNVRTKKYSKRNNNNFFKNPDGFNSRMKETEERISEVEDRIIETAKPEQQRENRLKEK